jgi:hypothetical protein
LAKAILNGDYDFKGEEERLNMILYSLLSRSEKHAFSLSNKRTGKESERFRSKKASMKPTTEDMSS